MFLKRFYLPIGILIICMIGFLLLRSDIPDEPIKICKVAELLLKSKVAEVVVSDVSQSGPVHTDSTFYAEQHAQVEMSEVEVAAKGEGVPVMHTIPVVTEPVNTQINAAMPKIILREYKVWCDWSK